MRRLGWWAAKWVVAGCGVCILGYAGCARTPQQAQDYAYAGDLRLRVEGEQEGAALSPSGELWLRVRIENPLGGYPLTVDCHSLVAQEPSSWPDGLRVELLDQDGKKIRWDGPRAGRATPARSDFVQLRPGWSVGSLVRVPVGDAIDLNQGHVYLLRLVVEVVNGGKDFGLDGWTGILTSNTIRFRDVTMRK